MKAKYIDSLIGFLNNSPTSFQAAEQIEKQLVMKGFVKLDETQEWKLTPGKKYYVVRNQSAVIAFVLGTQIVNQTGFNLAASHLDSPYLKIKPEGYKQERNNAKLCVELYGSPIISTWLDRELSLAGRILIKKKTSGKEKAVNSQTVLINMPDPVAIIPNAAIHINREVNKGFEYNAQNHLQAVLQASALDAKTKTLKGIISEHLGIKETEIIDFDLFLYDPSPAVQIGVNKEMLVSGRLDNLAMSQAILESIIAANAMDKTSVAVFYDNEEIGSMTPQGAMSSFTKDILQRICYAQELSPEQIMIAMRKSFLISTDMAHAVHPNFAEKHDPAYMPLINQGPVIKINASQRYATTSDSGAIFEQICKEVDVPVQKIINRSDIPSGSTIGPIASSLLSIPTVDIGNPMWAMHSIRETMGVFDHEYLIKALTHFYTIDKIDK